uniref:Defense protein 6 n=1 Tax=Lonomia obliqua TaxID=304329 RepID=DFP6_LONON|nr:RecName: Full=Defense protein 6; Short=DFP-6; Flags: Precursor [Lonomia obliqua]AAV91471.1 defense protein 6 [Lonomia obliqua]
MKTCLVFAFFLVAVFAAVQAEENDSPQTLPRRLTVRAAQSFGRCNQKQCDADCVKKGYFGGLCTLTSCFCTGSRS